ncbi:AABR07062185.1 [Phodopus roborovskii]|uniref:AABR07062185.1 protein n=1 Tax=Phodopus roborovskii TaxID=109678 RepID=A0AAV0AD65_PHORO|nr:AABR07062185.1 [Phodopus roborovskii]
MSDDEGITYTTVRFHKSSSGLQNRRRPEETQEPRESGHRESLVPWIFTVISLGILYFILLVTGTVLVILVFQCRQELQENQNNLNQRYSTMQNDSGLNETLRNKLTQCDGFKCQEGQINRNREQSKCCKETKVVLHCKQHTVIQGNWSCCGIKCYFLMDNKPWNGCKHACESCGLSSLKIDDDDELKSLKPWLTTNSYWIGLSRNTRKWEWVGDGSSKL